MHLARERAFAFQVRTSHVDLRSYQLAFVDALFQFQIEVRLQASRRANGGHAGGKIEAGKTQGHVMEEPSARRIEEMIMHAHEPGQSRVTAEVQPVRACGDLYGATRADGGYLVAGDQDSL